MLRVSGCRSDKLHKDRVLGFQGSMLIRAASGLLPAVLLIGNDLS